MLLLKFFRIKANAMTGKDLKRMIISDGLTVAEVARRLGTTQQNLTCALGKDDIKTGLLERVAEAMNKPLGFFYGKAFESVPVTCTVQEQVPQSSEDSVLDLLKLKDEQLLIAMKQTSKAQEQMDKVLEVLTSPAQAQTVTPAVYFAKGGGGVEPVTSRPYTQRLRANARRLSALTGPHVLGPAEIRVSAASEPKIK
jgi:transcriptional regulator with XRE-family HTH domain